MHAALTVDCPRPPCMNHLQTGNRRRIYRLLSLELRYNHAVSSDIARHKKRNILKQTLQIWASIHKVFF